MQAMQNRRNAGLALAAALLCPAVAAIAGGQPPVDAAKVQAILKRQGDIYFGNLLAPDEYEYLRRAEAAGVKPAVRDFAIPIRPGEQYRPTGDELKEFVELSRDRCPYEDAKMYPYSVKVISGLRRPSLSAAEKRYILWALTGAASAFRLQAPDGDDVAGSLQGRGRRAVRRREESSAAGAPRRGAGANCEDPPPGRGRKALAGREDRPALDRDVQRQRGLPVLQELCRPRSAEVAAGRRRGRRAAQPDFGPVRPGSAVQMGAARHSGEVGVGGRPRASRTGRRHAGPGAGRLDQAGELSQRGRGTGGDLRTSTRGRCTGTWSS